MKIYIVGLALVLAPLGLGQGKPSAPFHDPNDPDDPGERLEYKGEVKVPKDGKVSIPFLEPFGREPSCEFEGATIPGQAPQVTPYYATIKAKPGKKLRYRCAGIKHENK